MIGLHVLNSNARQNWLATANKVNKLNGGIVHSVGLLYILMSGGTCSIGAYWVVSFFFASNISVR